MKLLTKVTILVFFLQLLNAQTIDPKKLNDEISLLNDRNLYEKSFLKIEEILENPKATHYDKFNAHLQKYHTYKRVVAYASASESLENAKEEGLLSDRKEEVLTKIAVEEIFNKIQFQAFKEASETVEKTKNDINIEFLDADTKGFFLTAIAILNIIDEKFTEADKNLNLAVEIFEKDNPKHLANVYRKKMDLYEKMGNEPLFISSFEKGMFYAKKYNVEFYQKNLYESMMYYYINTGNLELAKHYKDKANGSSSRDYNSVESSSKLKKIEQQRKREKERKAKKDQEFTIIIFSVISVLLIILVSYFYKQYKTNKKTRILAEENNEKMYQELQEVLQQYDHSNEQLQAKESELSERQNEILELLKQRKTNKEIASILFISENTVKYHLKIIYNILDIKHRSQIIG